MFDVKRAVPSPDGGWLINDKRLYSIPIEPTDYILAPEIPARAFAEYYIRVVRSEAAAAQISAWYKRAIQMAEEKGQDVRAQALEIEFKAFQTNGATGASCTLITFHPMDVLPDPSPPSTVISRAPRKWMVNAGGSVLIGNRAPFVFPVPDETDAEVIVKVGRTPFGTAAVLPLKRSSGTMHAIILGQTGRGKTYLTERIINQITPYPVIVLDPKGGDDYSSLYAERQFSFVPGLETLLTPDRDLTAAEYAIYRALAPVCGLPNLTLNEYRQRVDELKAVVAGRKKVRAKEIAALSRKIWGGENVKVGYMFVPEAHLRWRDIFTGNFRLKVPLDIADLETQKAVLSAVLGMAKLMRHHKRDFLLLVVEEAHKATEAATELMRVARSDNISVLVVSQHTIEITDPALLQASRIIALDTAIARRVCEKLDVELPPDMGLLNTVRYGGVLISPHQRHSQVIIT